MRLLLFAYGINRFSHDVADGGSRFNNNFTATADCSRFTISLLPTTSHNNQMCNLKEVTLTDLYQNV